MRFLAKQAGINPDRDITITAIPDGANMIAAMSRGRVDGFVIPPTGEDAIRNHGAQPMFTAGRGEVKALDGFVYIGVIARDPG
ncbi:ABC transporter substrate-binding protein [Pseudoroseomonas wenyumeiae]